MRSAFVAASVVLLVSGVSLAAESAAVQELQAEAARVAAALPKAEKAAAAAAKALPGVTKQREQCEQRAESTKGTCEDNCEETMRRCRAANYLRSNAAAACEERGETCTSNCGATATKTCAALNAKEEKLSDVVNGRDALRSELADIESRIAQQREFEARQAAEAAAAAAAAAAKAKAAAEVAVEVAAEVAALKVAAQVAVIPAGSVKIEGVGTKEVKSFSIDVFEVTVDAYAACVRAGNCSKPDDDGPCNWGKSARGNHPVNCVGWNQANSFCGWVQKRLPTEEEWQLAAEGAQGRTYPWGEAAPSRQLYCGSTSDGDWYTCAVGSFPSGDSAQGVKDLSGNVWEWTESCYDSSCKDRVVRGGGWFHDDPSGVRAASRFRDVPAYRWDSLGFRCARSN